MKVSQLAAGFKSTADQPRRTANEKLEKSSDLWVDYVHDFVSFTYFDSASKVDNEKTI